MERGSAGQLLAVNTFVWVTTALYAPFIGAYYAEQGITPFQVGVLTAIGPVVSTLIQPLWAYISDRLGKRRRVLMIVTIGSGLTILTYLLHVSFHAFVAATLCFTVFQTSILPLADALVTQEAARQKANFAKIRMGGTTGYAITALVLGNFQLYICNERVASAVVCRPFGKKVWCGAVAGIFCIHDGDAVAAGRQRSASTDVGFSVAPERDLYDYIL